MLTPEERFLWVDLTYPIRAIYLPSTFSAYPQKKAAEMKILAYEARMALGYGQKLNPPAQQPTANVPKERNAVGWIPEYTVGELEIQQNPELGLSYQPTWTARLDIQQLALALHFITLFKAGGVELIKTWQASGAAAREAELGDSVYIKHADVINLQEGTTMKEKPIKAEVDWLKEVVENFVGVGLGLIPYVGPFLAMGQGKVPHYRFKSGLEADHGQPVYVGEDGEGAQQEPFPKQKEKTTEADQWTMDPDEAHWGGNIELFDKAK
ncbi:hypothetical protein BDW62DRAFT_205342 [Aspergillus aurantiobrunneus]